MPGPAASDVVGSRRPVRRRRRTLLLVAAALVALALAGGWFAGFRLNLTDQRVEPPTAAASADEVVTTYVEAYDHRDFATLRAIYPSESVDRFRAMGTMSDLVIVSSESLADPDTGNAPVPGRQYWRVRVTVTLDGLEGSDLAYRPGPNGWAYLLERDRTDQPWTIVDHGNP